MAQHDRHATVVMCSIQGVFWGFPGGHLVELFGTTFSVELELDSGAGGPQAGLEKDGDLLFVSPAAKWTHCYGLFSVL